MDQVRAQRRVDAAAERDDVRVRVAAGDARVLDERLELRGEERVVVIRRDVALVVVRDVLLGRGTPRRRPGPERGARGRRPRARRARARERRHRDRHGLGEVRAVS